MKTDAPCPHCHGVLTNSSTQKGDQNFPHYVHRKGQRKDDCPLPPNIPADKLEAAIWERLAKEVNIEAELHQALIKKEQDSNISLQSLQEEIAEIRRAITENRNAHDRTLELFQTAGGKPDPLTVEKLADLSKFDASLEAQLAGKLEKLKVIP